MQFAESRFINDRHRYQQSDEFRYRINKAAKDAEDGSKAETGQDANWLLGTSNRHRGSVHSDIWTGTAADLASRGMLAVYPVTGWWKTRKNLERYHQTAPYSLLVSIQVPEVEVDLYQAIYTQLPLEIVV